MSPSSSSSTSQSTLIVFDGHRLMEDVIDVFYKHTAQGTATGTATIAAP
jgi:hypothetical protein